VLTLRGGLIDEINTFLEPWALTLDAPESEGCGRSLRPMDSGPSPEGKGAQRSPTPGSV
jgi:hypothetical protein